MNFIKVRNQRFNIDNNLICLYIFRSIDILYKCIVHHISVSDFKTKFLDIAKCQFNIIYLGRKLTIDVIFRNFEKCYMFDAYNIKNQRCYVDYDGLPYKTNYTELTFGNIKKLLFEKASPNQIRCQGITDYTLYSCIEYQYLLQKPNIGLFKKIWAIARQQNQKIQAFHRSRLKKLSHNHMHHFNITSVTKKVSPISKQIITVT